MGPAVKRRSGDRRGGAWNGGAAGKAADVDAVEPEGARGGQTGLAGDADPARPADGRPLSSGAWSRFAEAAGSRMQVTRAHERRRGTGERAGVATAIAVKRPEECTR